MPYYYNSNSCNCTYTSRDLYENTSSFLYKNTSRIYQTIRAVARYKNICPELLSLMTRLSNTRLQYYSVNSLKYSYLLISDICFKLILKLQSCVQVAIRIYNYTETGTRQPMTQSVSEYRHMVNRACQQARQDPIGRQ